MHTTSTMTTMTKDRLFEPKSPFSTVSRPWIIVSVGFFAYGGDGAGKKAESPGKVIGNACAAAEERAA